LRRREVVVSAGVWVGAGVREWATEGCEAEAGDLVGRGGDGDGMEGVRTLRVMGCFDFRPLRTLEVVQQPMVKEGERTGGSQFIEVVLCARMMSWREEGGEGEVNAMAVGREEEDVDMGGMGQEAAEGERPRILALRLNELSVCSRGQDSLERLAGPVVRSCIVGDGSVMGGEVVTGDV
jgi:hypothetical protein